MKVIEKISILGDSISKGVVLDTLSQKYRILKESAADLFSSENNVVVKNYAKFGCTSERALTLIGDIVKEENKHEIILIELGGNDCDYKWDEVAENPDGEHHPNVELETFRLNIAKIIEIVKASGRDLAFMTLPPIDAQKYFNWITHGDAERMKNIKKFISEINYIYRHQELYATALEEIATQNNVYKIPVRAGFLAIPNCGDYICDDGIHLNEQGQEVMKKIFNDTYNEYINKK